MLHRAFLTLKVSVFLCFFHVSSSYAETINFECKGVVNEKTFTTHAPIKESSKPDIMRLDVFLDAEVGYIMMGKFGPQNCLLSESELACDVPNFTQEETSKRITTINHWAKLDRNSGKVVNRIEVTALFDKRPDGYFGMKSTYVELFEGYCERYEPKKLF